MKQGGEPVAWTEKIETRELLSLGYFDRPKKSTKWTKIK